MANKKIISWIKSEEVRGYSEGQLRQALIRKGFGMSAVNEAIMLSRADSNQGFHRLVSQKGALFMVLFYILLAIFSLQLIGAIIFSIISLNYLNLILPAVFGSLAAVFLVKKRLYGALVIMLLLLPFGVIMSSLIPLAQSFIDMGSSSLYSLIPIHALLIGLLSAYMFSKASSNFKNFLASGIVFSSVLAFAFAVSSMAASILSKLSSQLDMANSASGIGLTGIFGSITVSINIAFALALAFFNIPYFVLYSKREDADGKMLLFYSIPVIIFILLSYLLKYAADMLLAVSI